MIMFMPVEPDSPEWKSTQHHTGVLTNSLLHSSQFGFLSFAAHKSQGEGDQTVTAPHLPTEYHFT